MFGKYVSEALMTISRCVIAILMLFFMARAMGKKQISQLNYFDYIVGISIGSIAAELSFDKKLEIFDLLISLVIWGAFPVILSIITLKSIKLRRKLESTSTILIQNGKIIEKNLTRERYHINDLLEELRMKGAFNIADVESAILETNGQVSVQLKSEKQPVTCEDLFVKTISDGLCVNLIIDGKIMHEHLKNIKKNEEWLRKELEKQNFLLLEDVLLATMDGRGTVHVYRKAEDCNGNILD